MDKVKRNFNGNNIIIVKKKKNIATINGDNFYMLENLRGKRTKFWISTKESRGEYINHFLFKQNRNVQSREDVGEVLYYLVGKQINLPVVESHLARYIDENNNRFFGVTSKNFKSKKSIMEVSGKTLLLEYARKFYDNNNGKKVTIANNVETYLKAIKYLYPNDNIDYKKIRLELSKLALTDVILWQTDRHWDNITFLLDTDKGTQSLCVAENYDNGNILYLNRSIDTIQNYLTLIKNNDQNFINKIFGQTEKTAPLFSISLPSTNRLLDKSSVSPDEKPYNLEKSENVLFINDIAKEIVSNPKLLAFYNNIKENIDVLQAFKQIEISKTALPEYIVEFSDKLVKHRLEKIEEAVLKIVKAKERKSNSKIIKRIINNKSIENKSENELLEMKKDENGREIK